MMIQSVFQDEQELLKAVIEVHSAEGIDLDPMYFKGNFYKQIPKPKMIYDINPQVDECQQADATKLPINSNSIKSMILDPPFMFGIHGKTKSYYSSATHGIFKDFIELEDLYKGILKEAHRVLQKKGILIFKCQDYTDSKTTMVHSFVWLWGIQQGFYPKDLAILWLPKNKVYNPNLKQRHLRKTHSYFWIFEKSTAPVVTLNPTDSTFPTEKAINMDLTATASPTPKCPSDTSLNPNIIKSNFEFILQDGSNS